VIEILQKSPLFEGLSGEEVGQLTACLGISMGTFGRGKTITRQSAAKREAGVVLSGQVLVVQEDFWGHETIVSVCQPGQLFWLTGQGGHEQFAVTHTPCQVMFVDVTAILLPCQRNCHYHRRLVSNLFELAVIHNRDLMVKITHLTKRTLREKLLSYLSEQAERQNSDSFDIPLNRQQLANYLAVDRSALSNQLCKMRDEGWLTFHKNHFTLHRPCPHHPAP